MLRDATIRTLKERVGDAEYSGTFDCAYPVYDCELELRMLALEKLSAIEEYVLRAVDLAARLARLRIPGQQDRHHVQLAVPGRQLVQRQPFRSRAEIRLGRLDVAGHAAIQPVRGGQVHMEVNGAQGHRLIVVAGRTTGRSDQAELSAAPAQSPPMTIIAGW